MLLNVRNISSQSFVVRLADGAPHVLQPDRTEQLDIDPDHPLNVSNVLMGTLVLVDGRLSPDGPHKMEPL